MTGSFKTEHTISYDPIISLLGIYPIKCMLVYQETCMIAKHLKQPKYSQAVRITNVYSHNKIVNSNENEQITTTYNTGR